MLFAWMHERSVLSAWGNQTVQSILFMNTDQGLWQVEGKKCAIQKDAIEKSHFFTF